MEEFVKWYWEHGIKRGTDINDPNRQLRKITIGGWLDPLVYILERNKNIKENIDQKACLALWGPSQTGKSTLMSQYIDGNLNDGSDSALTWNDAHFVRFSPPQNGVANIPEGTLVFNPFNHGNDASGVATRYVLKSAASGEVNPEYPIEFKLTNRVQIIQSLSLGYLSECNIAGERINYTQESFLEEIGSADTCNAFSQDAYILLKDIANVIEFMQGDMRFNNLFKNNSWKGKIRKALVSSPAMLGDIRKTEEFLAKLFWDSNEKITQIYKEMDSFLSMLSREWGNAKILASMEVGALLLDIDSYNDYKHFDSINSVQARKVYEKITNLSYEKVSNEIHIFIGKGGTSISGDYFGDFQALCAELVVPIKQETLEASSEKNKFLSLVTKCDLLDFPGVSNKDSGINITNTPLLVDLSTCDQAELFTRVFKQGKTQCIVYNYVRKYGIDSFAILARTDRYPAKSSILNAGISEWIRSYDKEWKPGSSSVVPVFINMTFFSSLLDAVSLNGAGPSGLSPYVERIQGELVFAAKESSTFYPTTYPQFPNGKITNPASQESTIKVILNDPTFISSTGMKEETIRSVYSEDGGVDYMLENITKNIEPQRRRDLCRGILSDDKREFIRLIENQLPSPAVAAAGALKAKLQQCSKAIYNAVEKAEQEEDYGRYCDFANELKNLFSASASIFAPLPTNANARTKHEVETYIKEQIAKWYEYKISNLEESDFLATEDKKLILMALRDTFNVGALYGMIKNHLGQLSNKDMTESARYPFALAVNNVLKTGKIMQESNTIKGDRNPDKLNIFIQAASANDSNKDASPYYHSILLPIINRLDELAQSAMTGARPAQPGDAELKAIFDKFLNSDAFKM